MILSVNKCRVSLWRLMTAVTCLVRLAFVLRGACRSDGNGGRNVIGTSCTQMLPLVVLFVLDTLGSKGKLFVAVASFIFPADPSCETKTFMFHGMLAGNWFVVGPFITLVFDCMLLRTGRLVGISLEISFEKSSLYFRLSDSVRSWLRWKFT